MKTSQLSTIKTPDEARQAAIDWQVWAADQSLSYGELADWAATLHELGERFNLIDEFTENGIL